MAFVPLAPVATGDLATAALHNTLLDNTNWLELRRSANEAELAAIEANIDVVEGNHTSLYNYVFGVSDPRIAALEASVVDITTGVHEFWVPISAFRRHVSAGPGPVEDIATANGHYVSGAPYDPTSNEYASFFFPLPKRWNNGTLTFQVYSFNTAGGSGDFVFSLYPNARGDGTGIGLGWATVTSVVDSAAAALDWQVSAESAPVSVYGFDAEGYICWFLLARLPTDGSDTYASDIYVSGIKIRLTVNDTEDD